LPKVILANSLPPGHLFFLVASAAVITAAGVAAVIREVRQQGFLWRTWALRCFFLLAVAGVGYWIPFFAKDLRGEPVYLDPVVSMIGAIILFVLVFSAEVFAGTINISVVVFGGMIGIVVAHVAYFLVLLVIEPLMKGENQQQQLLRQEQLFQYAVVVKTLLSVLFAYLFVLLIHKNRDRFNFIIPYVEFRREHRGGSQVLVDTSAIIDGRLLDLVETHIIEGPLVVPKFVLRELHTLADSSDKLKRARGRRGIDMLNRLRKGDTIEVQIDEGRVPGATGVDAKLIKLAETLGARILTTDTNLNKIANVQNVAVVNVNQVAAAVKPSVLPGEELTVDLIRPGESKGQAVGYMDDGTMVVVENARPLIGQQVGVIVTRVLQTSAGRLIFAKLRRSTPESGDGGDA
jgi:uncharacterized protein YacL